MKLVVLLSILVLVVAVGCSKKEVKPVEKKEVKTEEVKKADAKTEEKVEEKKAK